MLIHVKSIEYLRGYELQIEFNDGAVKNVDLCGELYGEVFAPLKDIEFFKRLYVDEETRTVT